MKTLSVLCVSLALLGLTQCKEQTPASDPDADAEPTPEEDASAPDRGEGPLPGAAAVWAITDGERIERDDLAHPGKEENSAWQGGTIRLFGARNEVIAFQVVVESGADGIESFDARLPRLSERDGDAELVYAPPGEDPTEYVGRPIQIFTENYMNVEEQSRAGWVFRPDSPAAPSDPTGLKPVQLVPENARPGLGGLPMDVAPNENQALWIDLYLPGDLPPGMYDGAVELSAGGITQKVPVELEVLDFVLPDENSLNAMLYFEPEQVVRYQGRALDERYHRFAHRHRVELVNRESQASVQGALGRFDGSAFTAEHGYEGPGEGVGNRIVPASFYGPGSAYDDRNSAWQTSDAWMSFLADTVPGALTFLYMPDEPGPSDYPRIWDIADNIHSNPGPGRDLPIFVTSGYTGALDGAVDFWCSLATHYDPARARSEREAGRRYGFYNGTRPGSGALVLDAPATDARVNPWAAFKHDVDLYFYWHADHWRHNWQKQGDRDQNVWSNPVTFDNRGQPGKSQSSQGFINGDGVLLYPGEEVLHPEQDRGIAGPISSIRLANLRRGLQDHLYLTLARDLGLDEEVEEALSLVVPAVFAEAGSSVEFAERGDLFEQARYDLARAIAGAD